MIQDGQNGEGAPLRDGLSQAEPDVSALRASIPSANIKMLWEITSGKAWEPGNRNHPQIQILVAAGYLSYCPMRCGFEAFDTGVKWTEAGKKAAQAIEAQTQSGAD